MASLARWCFRHRVLVLVGWTVLLAVLAGGHALVGSRYPAAFELPGSDSQDAQALLAAGDGGHDAGTVVLQARTGALTDRARSAPMNAVVAQLAHQPHVVQVLGPGSADGVDRLSADGRTAMVEVVFDRASEDLTARQVDAVRAVARRLQAVDVDVEFGGDAFGTTGTAPGSAGEILGFAAAAVVLLLVFGALVATAIPLLCGGFALVGALQTVGLLSHVVDIAAVAPRVATLVGLGVGVDYALFVLTRHREALDDGLSPEDAAVAAVTTSGRAVVLAGGSVMLAMVALLVPGVPFLRGMGLAAAVVVLFAVAASVTVSPAMFALAGNDLRSDRARRWRGRRAAASAPATARRSWWLRWSTRLERRPVLLGAVALAVMLVLAAPLLTVRLGAADEGTAAPGSTARRAYDIVAAAFGPGANGPLTVVAAAGTPLETRAFVTLAGRIATLPDVAAVGRVVAAGGGTATLDVRPASSPQSAATGDLIEAVRSAAGRSGLDAHVGGATASAYDFTAMLTRSLPLVLAYLVVSSAVVMLAAFRSVVVAVTAAVTNLLAAASSLGVVVVVFQWGWGRSLFGPGDHGPVDAFLPVLLAAILIGLSTDYHVFLVSRTREAWRSTRDHRRAVQTGQVSTSRVIAAAAAIMVSVFLAFALNSERTIAEFGVGLAAAVMLDAWLLRTVLVPAVMLAVGPATWWFPRTGRRREPVPTLPLFVAPKAGPPTAVPYPAPTLPTLAMFSARAVVPAAPVLPHPGPLAVRFQAPAPATTLPPAPTPPPPTPLPATRQPTGFPTTTFAADRVRLPYIRARRAPVPAATSRPVRQHHRVDGGGPRLAQPRRGERQRPAGVGAVVEQQHLVAVDGFRETG